MKYPKVLVGITIYDGKEYIWKKFYENLQKLSYPNYDILVVDNSHNGKFAKKLKRQNVNIVHIERATTSREALADSQNYIWEKVLSEDYDYLMFIESDLIPPRDIIERLMRHNVSVVGSMYYIGHAGSIHEPPRPCLFELEQKQDGSLGTTNLHPDKGWNMFGKGLQKIHGCGFGSTLIHKNVLQKVRFWHDLGTPIKHSDVLFYMDLLNKGYTVYVDTDIIIPHYNSDWKLVKDI